MSASGYVHVTAEKVVRETENAMLFVIEGEDVWLPKSQIDELDRLAVGDENVTVRISEWIAKQRGLEADD